MSASSQLEPWEREPLDEAAPAIEAMRRRCAGCPPARLVSAAAADALPPDEQAAVTAHVETCAACAELLSDFGQLEPAAVEPAVTDRILREVGRAATDRRPAWKAWRYWLPAAAALAVISFALFVPRRAPSPAPLPVPAPAAATVVSPSAQAEPSPGPPLEKPAVKLTMLALTWRSGNDGQKDFASAIAPALTAFRSDRYKDAERLLAVLAADYPSSVEVPFYQGVSQLFLGRPADAVATLRRADRLADDTFAADASWYLAVALSRAGHSTEAKARFAALCRGGGEYAARACLAASR